MKGLQALFRIRETYIGIFATIAFQLIFFTVWMTAYDGVNERKENLIIGVLNEDTALGQEIAEQIGELLPFNVKTLTSIDDAKGKLDDRNINMIIQIPADFTAQIQEGKTANIVYWINQANASLTKSLMEGVANQLTEEINHSMYSLKQGEVIKGFSQQFEQIPLEQDMSLFIKETVVSTISSLHDKSIQPTIIKTNDVEGFAANFVPLMVIISSFVGAMVMIMQHQQAAQLVERSITKWQLFFARQIMNIGVAFLLPFVTIGLMNIFNISSEESLLTIYIFQSLMFWAFLCLAQVFVLLFGNLGMVFNILALSLQLVTSGVLVPRAMLSDFYNKFAAFLPATYGAEGYYTIIFGGSSESISNNISSLGIIIGVTLVISVGAVAVRRTKTAVSEEVSRANVQERT